MNGHRKVAGKGEDVGPRAAAKESPCLRNGCFICCEGTEMPLTHEDVERIAALGFSPADFLVKIHGWLQLRNTAEGRCFFLSDGLCSIYPDRPEGCRSYPMVFDESRRNAALDPECGHPDGFSLSAENARRVRGLAHRLFRERMERMSPRTKRKD